MSRRRPSRTALVALALFTVAGAALLRKMPISDANISILGAALVAGLVNVLIVAAATPWAAPYLARSSNPDADTGPAFSARIERTQDWLAIFLMAFALLTVIVTSLATSGTIVQATDRLEANARAAMAEIDSYAPKSYRVTLAAADTQVLREGLYRTCVPSVDTSVKTAWCVVIAVDGDGKTFVRSKGIGRSNVDDFKYRHKDAVEK